MRILSLLFLVVAVSLVLNIACTVAYRRAKRGKFRISIRTLLALTALISVILVSTFGYRRAVTAQLTWIPVSSQQANSIFPAESIAVNSDGKHEFLYYPRRTSAQRLLGQHTRVSDASRAVDWQSVKVTTHDESSARAQLQSLQDADILDAGTFVIRGRVVDKHGGPLARAQVDLMGSYVFINHFQTRKDGTFTMPLADGTLKAPAGIGYYLRIRAQEETADNHIRWNTRYLSLNSERPEMVAIIVVPATIQTH